MLTFTLFLHKKKAFSTFTKDNELVAYVNYSEYAKSSYLLKGGFIVLEKWQGHEARWF
ncbi:MAG: hypothetical protein WAM07_05560 [Halobacillus sp.]|uniref:hypothetical protein n=1 Tax=Halobacillus sp. TaxID=56800 RepID=UPI003BB14048